MNTKTRVCIASLFAMLVAAVGVPDAQRRGGAPPPGPGGPGRGARATTGSVERITVHGKALESNAQGESPDRAVTVYLPPSYAGDQARRFPTVYLLHGAGGSESTFTEVLARLPQSADRLAGAQGFSEFIVVTPHATPEKGSLYASSPATGDWERFVAEDMVGYVDGHYRTLAHRMSRGLAGHDAGGYAAIRIGMKRPDVFANLFVMGVAGDPAALEIDKYASNLNAYYAIAMDVGTADGLLESNRQLHAAMTKLRIAHAYEEYDGDHTSRVRERIESSLLPFFARTLAAPANLTSPSAAADRLSTAGR
jgi:enterochelin esterase-like enzyme